MANEATPGVYDAKVADYGIGKTKKGDPMAMIRFAYADADLNEHFMNWYGSFNPGKATEITCEALAVCGWSTNQAADLAKGSGSGVLDENRVISITLKMDEYDGKTRLKVAYVNPPGGGGFREKMDIGEAVQAFAGLNIGAEAMAARKKHAPKEIVNHAPQMAADEPIPF